MINLFPDQEETLNEVRLAFSKHRSVLLRADTGWGKSFATSWLLDKAKNKGKTAWFTVPTDILFEQTEIAFKEAGLSYNRILSGEPISDEYPVTLCMIQTLSNRLSELKAPDFTVFDECVHIAAKQWNKVYDWLPMSTKILGLTACPKRASGEGLAKYFTTMVHAKPMKWLIANKRLSSYRAFCPVKVDMTGAAISGGDYAKIAIKERMKSNVVGKTLEHYQKICPGKKAIVFCYSIADSMETCNVFNKAGIKAEHIDGKTLKAERLAILKRFESGETDILCNVNLCVKGLSIKMIEVCIIRRPTKSLDVIMQIYGRSLRYHPDKPYCFILDMVGAVEQHGFPDHEREWDLNGLKKKSLEATLLVRTCKKCYTCFPPATRICPDCGNENPLEQREVEQIEGELAEIKAQEEKRSKQLKIWECRTLQDFERVAKELGHKPFWATIKYNLYLKKQNERKKYSKPNPSSS